jgi:hypothetical protein
LQNLRKVLVGGGGDDGTLTSIEMSRMTKCQQDETLLKANICHPRPPSDLALTIKMEMNLPFHQMRKLKK